MAAGLPESSVEMLLAGMKTGTKRSMMMGGQERVIPGATKEVLERAWTASYWSYAKAYRLGWWSVVPFVALATASVAVMRGVGDLMTEKVEASVERDDEGGREKVVV
jgi:hypothetical protein